MTKVSQHLTTETILAATTLGFLTILGAYWFQNRRKNAVPTVWQPVGKVKNLYIYPLKSARRAEIKSALCTEYGLQLPKLGTAYQLRDRNLVIFKEENKEIHRHPKMLLIETTASDENHIILTAPDMPELKVQIPNAAETKKTGKIHSWREEEVLTLDCGDKAAEWLSNYILETDSGLRLGFYDNRHRRNINKAYKKYFAFYPRLGNETTGMYSNLTSYLLLNQASVDDLRSKLPEADITVNNFRPNILVEGEDLSPFAEDDWKWVKIGNVVLYLVKPCTRCDFTTINPETTVKYENNEPLRTLRKYRLLKDLTKIELDGYRTVMGINMGLHNGGEISVDDVVYVGKM